ENVAIRKELVDIGNQLNEIMAKLSTVVDRSEIAPFLLDLGKPAEKREYLWYNNQPAKADVTLIDIYSQANHSIHIVDDYLSIKTLYLLQDIKEGVEVTVFSDNRYRKLHAIDYCDFRSEFPHIKVKFIKTKGKLHDRFIVLDFETSEERVFHCGPSFKDAGKRIAAITEDTGGIIQECLDNIIKDMLNNPPLKLK
ncbi:MAG: ORF6N domain-containing protein, partial [Clostridia bacterium]|nr:ORF6N domain-containing protein [Clostridia bacterium]